MTVARLKDAGKKSRGPALSVGQNAGVIVIKARVTPKNLFLLGTGGGKERSKKTRCCFRRKGSQGGIGDRC